MNYDRGIVVHMDLCLIYCQCGSPFCHGLYLLGSNFVSFFKLVLIINGRQIA